MAQNTNLNVTPYYDDFDKAKNFYRVLYRPGYPIQARELTTMQSILQNQVESVGSHLFKDGAMVIPGQVGYDLNVNAIMLQESFLGANVEDITDEQSRAVLATLSQLTNIPFGSMALISNHLEANGVWSPSQLSAFSVCLRASAADRLHQPVLTNRVC